MVNLKINELKSKENIKDVIAQLGKTKIVNDKMLNKVTSALEDILNDLNEETHENPHIICAGIYNAGKSTFLNAVIGDEKFATGDVPTTNAIKCVKTDKYVFFDTPGLNANDIDNETAIKAFKQADLIVFISDIRDGGLKESEKNYLLKLAEILGGIEFVEKNVIFLLSNKDQIAENSVQKVINEHIANINKALGFIPKNVIAYDSVTYTNGINSGQQILVAGSNIPEVMQLIEEKVKELDFNKIKEQKIESKSKLVSEDIKKLIEPICAKVEDFNKKDANVKNKIDKINQTVRKYKDYIDYYEKFIKNEAEETDKLNVEKPIIPMKPTAFIGIERRSSGLSGTYKSENSAKSAFSQALQYSYNKRESAAKRGVQCAMNDFENYLSYEKPSGAARDNYYYGKLNAINEFMAMYISELKNSGVKFTENSLKSISIRPEVPSNIRNEISYELNDDLVEYDSYTSLSWYVDQHFDTWEMETYERGFFGDREVTVYQINSSGLFSAINEMESDIRGNLQRNIGYAWGSVANIISKFDKKLMDEYTMRIRSIQKDVGKALVCEENNDAEVINNALNAIKKICDI